VDYDMNIMRKRVNEIQKEISAKKKVRGEGFFDWARIYELIVLGETTGG
jgi:hypothetical protein